MEDAQFAAVLGAPLIELLDCNLALANPSPSPSPNPSPNPSQVLEVQVMEKRRNPRGTPRLSNPTHRDSDRVGTFP